MESKFIKIETIRNKIQNEFFKKIKKSFEETHLALNKKNFDIISNSDSYSGKNSYCNYVGFLRFYFFSKKNENK